jgi:hypothetical protein
MDEDPRNDTVGYKRPPRHTRFRPGQSGNPRGRPKGGRNLATDLGEELAERIRIREGKRNLRVSKQRALLKALVATALKGDTRAAGIILQLLAKVLAPADPETAAPSDDLVGDDLAILERFISRHLAARK